MIYQSWYRPLSLVYIYTRLSWQKAIFHDIHEEYLYPTDTLIDLQILIVCRNGTWDRAG